MAGGVIHFERLENDVVLVSNWLVLAPWAGRTLLLTLGKYHFRVVISFVLLYHVGFIIRVVSLALPEVLTLDFLALKTFTKIIVTPVIDKLRDKLFTYLVSRLVRQNAVRAVISPHMREIAVLHVLVQFQVPDPILEQLIVLLEFHFIVHE